MVTMIPFDEGNIIGILVEGEIDDEGVKKVLTTVDEKSTQYEKLRIYAEIKEPGLPKFKTQLESLPSKFKHISTFEKEAIVSDRAWIEAIAKIGDHLFPSIEVRHFTFDEIEKAKEWIKK